MKLLASIRGGNTATSDEEEEEEDKLECTPVLGLKLQLNIYELREFALVHEKKRTNGKSQEVVETIMVKTKLSKRK